MSITSKTGLIVQKLQLSVTGQLFKAGVIHIQTQIKLWVLADITNAKNNVSAALIL